MKVIEVNNAVAYEAFKLSAHHDNISRGGYRAALDIETTLSKAPTGTSKMWSDLYGVAEGEKLIALGCTFDGEYVYVFKDDSWLDKSQSILEAVDWTMHNGAFDVSAMRSIKNWSLHLAHDTMGMQYLLDPDRPKGLGALSTEFLGVEDYKNVDYANIEDEPWEKVVQMNAQDVISTWRLYRILGDQLNADPSLSRVYQWILMPAARALLSISERGVPVFDEPLDNLTKDLVTEAARLLSVLRESTPLPNVSAYPGGWPGGEFNPGSPKQVGHVLFDLFNLAPVSYTPTGNPSTGKDDLLQLVNSGVENSPAGPWIELVLQHRSVKKSIGYVESWEKLRSRGGRLHPRFKPMHVVTGRLSSEYPNIQQVPRDPKFRSCFGSPDLLWMKADYSQIELRLAAWMSQDELMLEAFRTDKDIHSQTARLILGEDGASARQVGKTLNFGLLYGAGPATLQRVARSDYGLHLSADDARAYREEFFRAYPGLLLWHRQMEENIVRTGQSRSALGRVRYLPDAKVPYSVEAMRTKKFAAVREGINHPVQSLASDIMLRALTELTHSGVPLIATVHDEVDLLVPEHDVDKLYSLVKGIMEDLSWMNRFGIKITVPIVANVEVGPNWGELEEIT